MVVFVLCILIPSTTKDLLSALAFDSCIPQQAANVMRLPRALFKAFTLRYTYFMPFEEITFVCEFIFEMLLTLILDVFGSGTAESLTTCSPNTVLLCHQ